MFDSPVILVTGARGAANSRLEFLTSMLQRRHQVHVVDLAASTRGDISFDRMVAALVTTAQEVSELCQSRSTAIDAQHGADAPAVIGFGLGACVALGAAAASPARFSSLTLVAGWLFAPDKMKAIVREFEELLRIDAARANRVFRLLSVSAASWESSTADAGEINAALLRIGAALELHEQAAAAQTPTLIIGAEHDEFATAEQSQLLFGAIENARLAMVSSGHDIIAERPAELLSLLEPFLENPTEFPAGSTIAQARP